VVLYSVVSSIEGGVLARYAPDTAARVG
jgi:hypothetical protein